MATPHYRDGEAAVSSAHSKKAAHEAFVSGHEGCGLVELWLHVSLSGLLLCLVNQLRRYCCHENNQSFWMRWLFVFSEAFLIAGMTVLQFTLLSDWMPHVVGLVVTSTLVLLLLTTLPRGCGPSVAQVVSAQDQEPRRLFKDFQALLLLQTSAAILAVDFPAMPRRLAKTELTGVSPMDIGAPMFAFSSGLFAATPVAAATTLTTRYQPIAASASWRRVLNAALPLATLGLARTLAVKSTAYQEHVTEYGLHWNFFLTLACLRAAWPLVASRPGFWAVCLAIWHVFCVLPVQGGSEFLSLRPDLHRERHLDVSVWWWLFAANREGILSLPPYMSLYCFGAALARILLAFKTSNIRLMLLLAAASFLPPVLVVAELMPPPSRRLFNITFLTVCLSACCLGLFLVMLDKRLWPKLAASPAILSAIGASALPFFLLSNLLTGAVNFLVDTVAISNQFVATGIVAGYMACLVASLPVLSVLGCWLRARKVNSFSRERKPE